MPCNCDGKQCHQHLCPPMLINDCEDAVADSEPDEGGGIDFDAQRNCAMDAEVLDILTEDTVVYKPIMEAFR